VFSTRRASCRRPSALVLTVALIAAVLGLGPAAALAASAPPMITVTCTATVSYGDEMTCWAASTDSQGNFAEAGTFTFDKAHALAATWTATTCHVDNSQCEVDARLAAPPGAQPRTVSFVIGFKGADGATVSTTVSVDVTLRPTVTDLTCASVDLPLGGSSHCTVTVADQIYDWDSRPAQLPSGVGLTVVSSAPGDTIRYDKPLPGGNGCAAAAANNVLTCGFTLTTDQVQGVRSVWASYPGDPAADEQSSSAVLRVANGPRVAPTLTLTCPDTVPARTPVANCQVSVAAPAAGLLTPTGAVALDQDNGQPVSWADAATCQLVHGSCSVPVAVFQPTFDTTPPVRATYAGDDAYLPASSDQQVDVLPTPTSAKVACDESDPSPNTLLHCALTLSIEPGLPVPIGPLDAVFVSTSDGSITCDVSLQSGCGGVDTDTATTVGFTVALDASTGPQLLVAEYTGDQINQVAGSSAGFSWDIPTGAVVQRQPPPPPGPPAPQATTTAIACVGPVAYRHATQCTVAVTAAGAPVTSGSVRVAPAVGSAFPTVTCLLSDQGTCTVAVSSHALPGVAVWLTPSFSGTALLAASTGSGHFVVHAVPTSVTVHCAGGSVHPGSIVSCVASVRTRYGAAAAKPPAQRSQVTVSVRGDTIVYGGQRAAKSCHWTLGKGGLTCHFSVRAGHSAGVHVVRAHYNGTAGSTHNAASVGQAKFTVQRKR
jgi:hypothetical protein